MRIVSLLIFALTSALLSGAQTYSQQFDFTDVGGVQFPQFGLANDAEGNLYGVTGATGSGNDRNPQGAVYELSLEGNGWTETTLASFQQNPDGGGLPEGSPLVDQKGNVYVEAGGIVYELSDVGGTWTQTALNSSGSLGLPSVVDATGNLYGRVENQIYELSPGSNGWKVTILYTFSDGGGLRGPLVMDSGGNVYGADTAGGVDNGGSIFKLLAGSWTKVIIHEFREDSADSVAMDTAGNLYAVVVYGPGVILTKACEDGCQQVVRFSPSGSKWTTKVLHSFPASSNWAINSPLAIDGAGSVYGTSESGGKCATNTMGCGTVFKLSAANGAWKLTTLHIFNPKLSHQSNPHDGYMPEGGLLLDSSGNLWGTTIFGGNAYRGWFGLYSLGCGTVFEIELE